MEKGLGYALSKNNKHNGQGLEKTKNEHLQHSRISLFQSLYFYSVSHQPSAKSAIKQTCSRLNPVPFGFFLSSLYSFTTLPLIPYLSQILNIPSSFLLLCHSWNFFQVRLMLWRSHNDSQGWHQPSLRCVQVPKETLHFRLPLSSLFPSWSTQNVPKRTQALRSQQHSKNTEAAWSIPKESGHEIHYLSSKCPR